MSDKPSWRQVAASALAAAFGVQNDKNRERDFKHGQIKTFIIAGIVFTTTFVLILVFVVSQVVKHAAS